MVLFVALLCGVLFVSLLSGVLLGTNDQLVRIAAAHRHAPELHLAWLNNIAAFHTARKNAAAAAETFVHIAVLIACVVRAPVLPDAAALGQLSPNVASLVGGLVTSVAAEVRAGDVADFTVEGFLKALDSARRYFCEALLFHAANNVCKVGVAVMERMSDYESLVTTHGQLQALFQQLIALNRAHVKYVGSYYRVGYFGKAFGTLDACEFIYHEPQLTKLGHFKDRLTRVYEKQLGRTPEFFFDSKPVDRSKLNAEVPHLQLTAVEPFRPMGGGHECYLHVKTFFFETPFTTSGASQAASLAHQYKRKSFLTTEQVYTSTQLQKEKNISLTTNTRPFSSPPFTTSGTVACTSVQTHRHM